MTVDTSPPQIIYCPSDFYATTEVGNSGTPVTWGVPVATDNSGGTVVLTSSHEPGQTFSVGTTLVSYEFKDTLLNKATCNFTVNIATSKITLTYF